jgi:hypothetical protein
MAVSTTSASEPIQVLLRSTYSNFKDAGIDTFTTQSGQAQTSWLDLNNLLPAANGALRRRWGVNRMFSSDSSFQGVRTFAYNVPQDGSDPSNTAAADLLVTTDNQNLHVTAVSSTGTPATATTNTLAFAAYTGISVPTNFSASGDVSAVVSRNWFYYSDGQSAFRKCNMGYTTKDTNTNCGILPPSAYLANTSGSNPKSTITAYGGSGTNYTSPTVTLTGGGGTGAACSAIVRNGAITGFSMTAEGSGYTSAPDVEISDSTGSGAGAVAVYNELGAVVAVLPTGPIVLNAERVYTYAWQNSLTGHTSDIAQGIVTASTGEITSYTGNAASVVSPALGVVGNVPQGVVGFTDIYITITPILPIDSQVDTCILMATSDGGSLEKLYGVAEIPISPTSALPINYTDTLPDTYLSSGAANSEPGSITVGAVTTSVYTGDNTGIYSVTSGDTPLSTQTLNSLMFGTTPSTLIPGMDSTLNNEYKYVPWNNQALTDLGTWSNDVVVENTGDSGDGANSFQMALTGTFTIETPGDYVLVIQSEGGYIVAIGNSAAYVSGPNTLGGVTTSPVSSLPVLGGQNDDPNYPDTVDNPLTINFPTAGTYPFEFGYAACLNQQDGIRMFTVMANTPSGIADSTAPFLIVPSIGDSNVNGYTGLTLLAANTWVDTDSYGTLYGIIDNSPPPPLKFLTLHQGRLFGVDEAGQNVYFSKSIDEVTTSTGLITSKWEEAWPGTNVLPISLNNEHITALKSDGTNLHIGTTKSIYTLQGSNAQTFSIPNILFQETGVLSNDLWTVIYSEGQPAGFMWMTPDLKLLYSDFSTYVDVGIPIYPFLQNLVGSYLTTNAKANAFTFGPFTFAVFSLQTSTANQFFLFETNLRKWYRWTVSGTPLHSFVYQHPETGYRGLFYWEVNSGDFSINLFDPSYTTDGGQAIPWNAQTSWTGMTDAPGIKYLNEIEVLTNETTMAVSVYGANTQTEFTSPTTIATAKPLVYGPMQTWKCYLASLPSGYRYYSYQFSSTVTGAISSSPTEILDQFIVEFYPLARI